jgi:predicted small lipoprotein YifL
MTRRRRLTALVAALLLASTLAGCTSFDWHCDGPLMIMWGDCEY